MSKMKWLRELRTSANLTQCKLAEKLDEQGFSYTPGAIGHWEKGKYHPPLDDPHFRRALATALRVTEAELLAAAGYNITPQMHSPEAIRAAAIVDQMPPKARKMAIDILERMAEG